MAFTSTSSSAYSNSVAGRPLGVSIGALGVAATGALTLTFVGTGLDLFLYDSANGGSDQNTFQIDGGSVTNMPYSSGSTTPRTIKIVSGLPYGTHTFTFNKVSTASTFLPIFVNFTVYQPKKNGLLPGEVELADYNLMANFVANAVAGLGTMSTGVLRKTITRELTYVGTWSITGVDPANKVGGFQVSTSTNGTYTEYTFFGTGFDARYVVSSGFSSSILVSVDGLPLTVGNFPGLVTTAYGGGSFAAGTLSQNNGGTVNGSGMTATGLAIGYHRVRFTNNAAATFVLEALDIITPLHSVKANLFSDLQNSLPVGSQCIQDDRKLQLLPVSTNKAWAQAIGIASAPTTTASTPVPIPEMSCTIKTAGSTLDISFSVGLACSVSGNVNNVHIFVDGVQVTPTAFAMNPPSAGLVVYIDGRVFVPVSAGVHKVDLYWSTSSGTLTASGGGVRVLNVREF